MFKTKNGMAIPVAPAAPQGPRAVAKRAAVPTIVSADMVVEGNFQSTGELHVEGVVVGDIAVAKLIIAEGGSVEGDVETLDLRVCGTLRGSARAKVATLTASAVMTGDVVHELLTIETGAQLEGHCRRLRPEPEILVEEVVTEPEPEPPPPQWSNGHEHHEHHAHGD